MRLYDPPGPWNLHLDHAYLRQLKAIPRGTNLPSHTILYVNFAYIPPLGSLPCYMRSFRDWSHWKAWFNGKHSLVGQFSKHIWGKSAVYCHIEISQFVAPLIYVCTPNELISILVRTLILEFSEFRSANMSMFPVDLSTFSCMNPLDPSEEQMYMYSDG